MILAHFDLTIKRLKMREGERGREGERERGREGERERRREGEFVINLMSRASYKL